MELNLFHDILEEAPDGTPYTSTTASFTILSRFKILTQHEWLQPCEPPKKLSDETQCVAPIQ